MSGFNDPKWIPLSNPVHQKALGKLIEELSELTKICARIQIQGLHGIDPANGKTNISEIEKEIADVFAHSQNIIDKFELKIDQTRINHKLILQRSWENDL